MIYPMTDYSIVGIRFQMGDQLTYQEQTEAAARFVAKLEVGQRVLLVAEPENPWDASAVAAYIDYERIGYVNKEETAEVHQLLGSRCSSVRPQWRGRTIASTSPSPSPVRPKSPSCPSGREGSCRKVHSARKCGCPLPKQRASCRWCQNG